MALKTGATNLRVVPAKALAPFSRKQKAPVVDKNSSTHDLVPPNGRRPSPKLSPYLSLLLRIIGVL